MDLNLMNKVDIQLKTGPWNLSELPNVPKHNSTVFSCFHCGGGSTMGYKLAGYHVLGGVEIDPQMMRIYKANHNPKHSYLMGVQDFKNIPDTELPKELFELDILDGSPPCSSFSMAGSREDKWGKNTHFREGQTEQVLDDLFFHFIQIASKLKPKIVVAENVKGLILGNAKGYVKEIFQSFKNIGYECQLFLMNASRMGVPQARERTFFIANRINKKIKLDFNEKVISIKESIIDIINLRGKDQRKSINYKYYKMCQPGEAFSKYHPNGSLFNWKRLDLNLPSPTLTTTFQSLNYLPFDMFNLHDKHIIRLQTFPDDYNFCDMNPAYICGMSVPPFMMQRVAAEIYKQLL